MELSKEQELEMLKKAGIEDAKAFLGDKRLIYASEEHVVYESEDRNIVSVGFKRWNNTHVYGKGDSYIHGDSRTTVKGGGDTFIIGKGNTVVRGNGRTVITERGKE